jgi:hypothetical protein
MSKIVYLEKGMARITSPFLGGCCRREAIRATTNDFS